MFGLFGGGWEGLDSKENTVVSGGLTALATVLFLKLTPLWTIFQLISATLIHYYHLPAFSGYLPTVFLILFVLSVFGLTFNKLKSR